MHHARHSPHQSLVIALARAFVAGEQSFAAIHGRSLRVLGKPRRLLPALVARYLASFGGRPRPRVRDVVAFLRDDEDVGARLARAARMAYHTTRPARRDALSSLFTTGTATVDDMLPAPASGEWGLPAIPTPGALAEWLALSPAELDWMADLKGLGARAPGTPLGHYHYRLLGKRQGGVRLIEAPQGRLKAVQRRILAEVLDRVPPYYAAAHGFLKGRSIRTFAAPHVRKHLVLRIDLQDFFPCIRGPRVQTLFRTLGYPEPVADLLGGLCTNVAPRTLFAAARWPRFTPRTLDEARRVYSTPHLPQGAPTSPALANLCAYRLDCRLTGLADWAGADYTRYADDLAFSGDEEFARAAERHAARIAAIAAEEGWRVQHHKTRVMRQGRAQRLAGLTVNAQVAVPRAQVKALEATLVNCRRRGPATQNREGHADFRAHLTGRVSFVASVDARKGAKLRALLDAIDWS
jgi:RNA-directed DNA polymerase